MAHPEGTWAWADSAYSPLVDWANTVLGLTLQTVARPRGQKGFLVLPKRWVVERAISWIMRARRNVGDYGCLPQHSEAHIWTLITLMTRRFTKPAKKRAIASPAATPPEPARDA
ncbi:hypothetical protein [Streptomyces sp. AS02]|uniref:hypothetical protein n=1 Tax=Streptomyces sp. AS02 TaxID=2938946 RepID=UPI0034D749B7